ncbi:MAG: FGGY family carbohydrate kinase [Thermoleophilia bacterium]
MTRVVIGADIGSSTLKAVVVCEERGILAVDERPYPMLRPHPGWAENDAEHWWTALVDAVANLLDASGTPARDVKALCVSSQRDIAVLMDGDGQPLSHCIHWTDRRDPEETAALYETLGMDWLIDTSGTLPIPGLILPNLVWSKRHLPEAWANAKCALTPKDFIGLRLTGVRNTDPTGTTRSILSDWRTGGWSDEICSRTGIDRELLPNIECAAWQVKGELLAEPAAQLGLLPGTIIAGGGGDDQSAMLGCGLIDAGDLSIGCSSSTSLRIIATEPVFDETGMIGVCPHVVPDRYIGEIVVTGPGTSLRWFRETLGADTDFESLIAEAGALDAGSDGLLAFPYLEGTTVPVQRPNARAAFLRVDAYHQRAHFTRSLLEGVAYQYPRLFQIIEERGHSIARITLSDGEARSAIWNQIKADVTGREIRATTVAEAPAVGSAINAGVAAGVFANHRAAIEAVVKPAVVYSPDAVAHERYRELLREWEQASEIVLAIPPARRGRGA